MPRLPRKMPRRHGRLNQGQARHPVPSVPRLPRKTTVDVSCTTPATHNVSRCEFVPRLPRKMSRRHGRLNQGQARHPVPSVPRLPRKTTVDVSCTTPATHNDSRCEFVPRLPRKMSRRHGRLNQGQARHPVAVCTTPATQNDAKRRWM